MQIYGIVKIVKRKQRKKVKRMSKTVLYNSYVDVEELIEELKEMYKDEEFMNVDKLDAYEHAKADYEYMEDILDNVRAEYGYLIIANIGRWSGRFEGYDIQEREIYLTDILPQLFEDDNIVQLGRYDLELECKHHDSCNLYKIRKLKDLTDKQLENLWDKASTAGLTSKDISRYSISLKKDIMKAYGGIA